MRATRAASRIAAISTCVSLGLPSQVVPQHQRRSAFLLTGLNRDHSFFVYLANFTVHLPLQAKSDAEAKYRAVTDKANPQHNPIYTAMAESLDDVRRD